MAQALLKTVVDNAHPAQRHGDKVLSVQGLCKAFGDNRVLDDVVSICMRASWWR